jgi:hypothetical protein
MNSDLSIQLRALMQSHGIAYVLSEVSVALKEVTSSLPNASFWQRCQSLIEAALRHAEHIEQYEQVAVEGEHVRGTLPDVLYYIWMLITGGQEPVEFVSGYPSIDAAVIDFLVESRTELPKTFQWERPDGVIIPLEISEALTSYLQHQLQNTLV